MWENHHQHNVCNWIRVCCWGNGLYVGPNFERRQFWQKTASFLYFPQLWYLILSCFANCYRFCVNSIKVGQTPFFAATPEAELAAWIGQFSQSFQAVRNKSSLPKGDSPRPFRVCTWWKILTCFHFYGNRSWKPPKWTHHTISYVLESKQESDRHYWLVSWFYINKHSCFFLSNVHLSVSEAVTCYNACSSLHI